ncbi:hypothetical protein V6N11_047355 [Hibiscus sabdariffa]|uniref:Uncharacterized protein n=2 Tax=Hibiscus sabdariffa TaxID=183260 RepID=A0ABR2NK54_9ROSI
MHTSDQFVNAMVYGPSVSKEVQLTVIYTSPSYAFHKHIWSKIGQVKPSLDVSCVIGGDFKAILSDEERVGGSIHTTRGSRLFRDFIFSYGLIDLGFKGPPFTWTRGNLHERLDCCLVNDQWMLNYGDVFVWHLDKLGFDHRPLLLRLSDDEDRRVNRPFHFISMCQDRNHFQEFLLSVWSHSSTLAVNLDMFRNLVGHWNFEGFEHIGQRK